MSSDLPRVTWKVRMQLEVCACPQPLTLRERRHARDDGGHDQYTFTYVYIHVFMYEIIQEMGWGERGREKELRVAGFAWRGAAILRLASVGGKTWETQASLTQQETAPALFVPQTFEGSLCLLQGKHTLRFILEALNSRVSGWTVFGHWALKEKNVGVKRNL